MKRSLKSRLLTAAVAIPVGLMFYGFTITEDVDPENPRGREICYLSKEAANLPVTKADVDCYRVVIGEGYSKRLIAPKRVKSFQDYCVGDMQRNEDGTCDYLPPRE